MENKILTTLEVLLKDVANVTRRPEKTGSVDGDSEKRLAFDIKWFIDWEVQNHKNEKGSTLDNMDYWMPKIRENFPKCESYFHNSNDATIWINKDQTISEGERILQWCEKYWNLREVCSEDIIVLGETFNYENFKNALINAIDGSIEGKINPKPNPETELTQTNN